MQGDWKGEIVWIKNLRKRGKADEKIVYSRESHRNNYRGGN